MIVNNELVEFIREVRRRGYKDIDFVNPLIEKGWKMQEITDAIKLLDSESNKPLKPFIKQGKEKVEIYLDYKIHEIIRKRSRKNLLSIPEQIEDIVRRSCINTRLKKGKEEKLDDLLVGIFSRRKSGRQIKI